MSGRRISVVTPQMAERLRAMQLVDEIVGGREGWSVTMICANPEPTDATPLHCVEVFGEWYGEWKERSFRGRTRVECLESALISVLLQSRLGV